VVGIAVLIALLVCLIPTTIGGLLSAIGVAGMSRMMQANVIATSGRAVEAAGDVDVLLLDKTGTITLGNRQASEFLPAPGVSAAQLAEAAQLARWPMKPLKAAAWWLWPGAPWPAGAQQCGFSGRVRALYRADAHERGGSAGPQGLRSLRKGAADAVRRHVEALGGSFPLRCNCRWTTSRARAARRWWWPMAPRCWA
jgi:K+-transporting ATPase ATPase B chain